MSYRKHLRRLALITKYSPLHADCARLPYGLGRLPTHKIKRKVTASGFSK